jgi:hypothetical protein
MGGMYVVDNQKCLIANIKYNIAIIISMIASFIVFCLLSLFLSSVSPSTDSTLGIPTVKSPAAQVPFDHQRYLSGDECKEEQTTLSHDVTCVHGDMSSLQKFQTSYHILRCDFAR